MGTVIGIIIVLALAVLFAVLTCKSKSSDLFKWIGICIFVAFFLTWVIPTGSFSGGEFVEQGLSRLGFSDVPTILYYSVYFGLTTIIYLLMIGGFYGVLSKTKSYDSLVKKCAGFVKGHEVVSAIVIMVLIAVLTSILKNTLVLLVFIPFIISVLLNAKFDKITAIAVTFGSILIGMIGATYGTEGLTWFNSYSGVEKLTDGIFHRLIIGAIALVLFICYNSYRIVKIMKKNKELTKEAANDDLFEVSDVRTKVKTWPIIIVFALMFIIIILGYVNWKAYFNIDVFDNFHKWLIELTPFTKNFTIFSWILGTNAVAFGQFEINTLIIILLIITSLIGIMNRMKFSDFMQNFGEGFTKMFKPACLYALAYVVFICMYMSPVTANITNWAFGLTKSLNPFIATITATVINAFHADLGYTSYIVGSLITTNYHDHFTLLQTLFVSTYGLVQLVLPTSGLLLVGLAYLKVDYKSWFKYIWIFALLMLIVLLIYATIVRYAM